MPLDEAFRARTAERLAELAGRSAGPPAEPLTVALKRIRRLRVDALVAIHDLARAPAAGNA